MSPYGRTDNLRACQPEAINKRANNQVLVLSLVIFFIVDLQFKYKKEHEPTIFVFRFVYCIANRRLDSYRPVYLRASSFLVDA